MNDTPIKRSPNRRSVLIGSLCAAASFFATALPGRRAFALSGAESFIEQVGGNVLQIVNAGSSATAKKKSFFDLLQSKAARTQIAVFALGEYQNLYNALSGNKKSEYSRNVMQFVAGVFMRYINEFSGNRLEVTGSTERSASDIIVNSKVHFADGRSALDVRWRVTKTGGSFKVFDVRVLGVWAVLQARSEFESIIRQNGGTIDGLMDYLKRNS
jgi:phospholipid transport system substrate-binding protein